MQAFFFTYQPILQKRNFLLLLFLLLCAPIQAQLHIGIFGDLIKNITSYDRGYFGNYPEEIASQICPLKSGIKGGGYISLRYDLNHWVAVRTDVDAQAFSSREWVLTQVSGITLNLNNKEYLNCILTWPIMGCLYHQIDKFQVYECAGFYGSFLVIDQQLAMKKYDFGFVNCVGVGYNLNKKWSVGAETKYYRGFINQHHTGSKYFKQPIYYSWFEFSVGVTYSFDINK